VSGRTVDTHALRLRPMEATPRLYTGDAVVSGERMIPRDPARFMVDLNNTLGLTQFYPGMGVIPPTEHHLWR